MTQANGSGSNSITLIVDDALYFQDGSWGSDLTRGVTMFADWIAIGTVNNKVQISSIDYSTNTITLASAVSWSDNDPIWLYKKSDGTRVLYGAAPEYGAHEFGVASAVPTVSTSNPTSVSESSITFNANISALNGEGVSQKGFAYGTSADLSTVIATTSLGTQFDTGVFSQTISSLSAGTVYYYRAYAVNSVGTSTGSIVSTTTTAVTPTPTPTPTPSSSSGGGGGGGGGSSSGSVTTGLIINGTTLTPLLQSTISTSTCQTIIYPLLNKNLSLGSYGNDIYILQRILMQDKFMLASSTSLNFDYYLLGAISNFQKTNGIVSMQSSTSTGLGIVGPKTRAFINDRLAKGVYKSLGQCLIPQNNNLIVPTNTKFTRILKLGSIGLDVKALQVFLNNNGFSVSLSGSGSKGNETQYFGPATKNALIKFQEFYANEILLPSGLTKGTGNFGVATMKKVNSLVK